MKITREKIYKAIDASNDNHIISRLYNIFMMLVIIASLIPLCFVWNTRPLVLIDRITVFIFIIDYILRFITADFGVGEGKKTAFLTYPFRLMSIVDLLSILPSLIPAYRVFAVFRAFRLMRAFRIFKFFRYSKNIQVIKGVIVNKKDALLTVTALSLIYILTSALIAFQVEPYTFEDFFTAVYWATMTLTTVGYGDIYPVTNIGKLISMLSSFLGIAVIALPSGIIISGYMEIVDFGKSKKKKKKDKNKKKDKQE